MAGARPVALPELAYNLLTAYDMTDRLSGAVFLLHRSRHPHGYEDAAVFFCTPDAAKFFGYDNPRQVQGKFISNLIAPEDLIRVRSYDMAADFRQHAPTQYQMHLYQPNHRTLLVDIEVHRHWENGATRFWIGVMHKAEKAYPQETPLSSEQLAILWKQRMIDLPSLSVTQATPQGQEYHCECATHLQSLPEWPQPGHLAFSQPTTVLSQKAILSRQKSLDAVEKTQDLALVPGGTVMIHPDWYLHWCRHCLEPFRSKDPEPEQCGRRACRKKGWQTGADYNPQTRIRTYIKT